MTGLRAQVRRQSSHQRHSHDLDGDTNNTNPRLQTNQSDAEEASTATADDLCKLENEMGDGALRSRAFIRCALYVFGYVCLGWSFFGAKYGWSWVSAYLDPKATLCA